jgi:hypothetical protein
METHHGKRDYEHLPYGRYTACVFDVVMSIGVVVMRASCDRVVLSPAVVYINRIMCCNIVAVTHNTYCQ